MAWQIACKYRIGLVYKGEHGVCTVTYLGSEIQYSATPCRVRRAAQLTSSALN